MGIFLGASADGGCTSWKRDIPPEIPSRSCREMQSSGARLPRSNRPNHSVCSSACIRIGKRSAYCLEGGRTAGTLYREPIDSREPAEYLQFHVPVMRSRSTKGRTCFYSTKNQVTDPFPRTGCRHRPWHNAFDAAFVRQNGLVVSTLKQVLRSDAVLLLNAFNVHGI